MHEGFLRAICEEPDDDANRLIYADWLEENGCAPRALFIRTQIEIAQRTGGGPVVLLGNHAANKRVMCYEGDSFRSQPEHRIEVGGKFQAGWLPLERAPRIGELAFAPTACVVVVQNGVETVFPKCVLQQLDTDRRSSQLLFHALPYLDEEHVRHYTEGPELLAPLLRLERDLIVERGAVELCGFPLPTGIRQHFRRGFIREVQIPPSLLDSIGELKQRCPLRQVWLTLCPTYETMWLLSRQTGLDWRPGDKYESWQRVLTDAYGVEVELPTDLISASWDDAAFKKRILEEA